MTTSHVDRRRALLGALLRAGRPLTVDEVLASLAADGFEATPHTVADLLGHQTRRGRVKRTGRGSYAIVAEALHPSTIWRCLNWQRAADYRARRTRSRQI